MNRSRKKSPVLARKIICQRCKPSDESCPNCGGYGYLLIEMSCECGRKAWFKPGCHTVYEGKRYHSFDGLEFIHHTDGSNCIYCEETK